MARPNTKSTPKKPKLVRDSFTIPKAEFAAVDALKQRALGLGTAVKKSELLRAGLKLLVSLSDSAYLDALGAIPTLKTGRPPAEVAQSVAEKPAPRKRPQPASKRPAKVASAPATAPAKKPATKVPAKKPVAKAPVKKAVVKRGVSKRAPNSAPASTPTA